MRMVSFLFVFTLLQGCAVSGYEKFYQSYGELSDPALYEFLGEGQDPQLIVVSPDQFDNYFYQMRTRYFVPIGHSSFNGAYEDTRRAVNHAKSIGAVLVIVASKHTETVSSTVPIAVPKTTTTYSSGSFYSGGGYGSYSGTQTSYGSETIPITVNVRRYDQGAAYFIKNKGKARYGIQVWPIPQEIRDSLGRNTGALIDLVFEDSPAFYANVMRGDVLIEVDGKNVRNEKHAQELLMSTPADASSSTLRVIRAGNEINVNIEF